ADGVRCGVQLRAREGLRQALIRPLEGNRAEVQLEEPALPAPGQACVMYEGERVLGGGFILA
ncbi:MAG: tRNA 2-thiouridine(34) synthase MnmA, partial [Bifidobacteriales bacterium]|nr:tRNA 2-thiouridine(34) synthase MnmA [Bifidobacteriales bacterium]